MCDLSTFNRDSDHKLSLYFPEFICGTSHNFKAKNELSVCYSVCLIYNVCLSDVKRGGFLLSDLHQGYSSVSNHNTCVKFCHNKHFYMCGLAGLCVCVCVFFNDIRFKLVDISRSTCTCRWVSENINFAYLKTDTCDRTIPANRISKKLKQEI